MNKDLIDRAISNLQLLTIKLHTSNLQRLDEFIDDESKEGFRFQYMSTVRAISLDSFNSKRKKFEILRVFPKFGVRAVSCDKKMKVKKPIKVVFQIEAEFRADYLVRAPLPEAAVKEFSEYNAVYNAWPFWREHVFDIAARAQLPNIDIPLFSAKK